MNCPRICIIIPLTILLTYIIVRTDIAKEEGISDSDLKLLLVAAIYHDAGYLEQNNNHEQHSCEIARKYLPQFHYTKEDIDTICSIIMATKIPQKPEIPFGRNYLRCRFELFRKG